MRRKVNFLIPALKILALTMVIGIACVLGAGATSSAPEQLISCASCHSMEQEVAAWQEGPHSNLACMQCHLEGNADRLREELRKNGGQMVAQGGPHTIALQVAPERCEACHEPQMAYLLKDQTPPPLEEGTTPNNRPGQPLAVKAGHELHQNLAPGLECMDCHQIHGPQPGSPAYQEAIHARCQECHDQKQVAISVTASVSCAACHTDPATVAPVDHQPEGQWLADHGQGNLQTCGECHLDATAKPHGLMARPEAFPTQAGDSCAACHSGVPMPHPAGFLAQHGQAALESPQGTCESCHSPEKNPATPTPEHARADFCTRCHGGVTMPHPTGFLAGHGEAALASGKSACQTCHSASNPVNPKAEHAGDDYCTDCHGGVSMPHPQGFLGQHGEAALIGGKGTCQTCHSSRNPIVPGAHHAASQFCSDCHAGVAMPHPQSFLAGHGEAALSTGSAACQTCHSASNPVNPRAGHASGGFCTDCHGGVVMPHPDAFLARHGEASRQAPATCDVCHSPQNPAQPNAAHASTGFCADCHNAYQHPAGWVAGHGSSVDESCATCHTLQGEPGTHNSCAACHTGSATWHPKMWFVTHGQAVEKQGEATCQQCHAEVEPSCTKCHRE